MDKDIYLKNLYKIITGEKIDNKQIETIKRMLAHQTCGLQTHIERLLNTPEHQEIKSNPVEAITNGKGDQNLTIKEAFRTEEFKEVCNEFGAITTEKQVKAIYDPIHSKYYVETPIYQLTFKPDTAITGTQARGIYINKTEAISIINVSLKNRTINYQIENQTEGINNKQNLTITGGFYTKRCKKDQKRTVVEAKFEFYTSRININIKLAATENANYKYNALIEYGYQLDEHATKKLANNNQTAYLISNKNLTINNIATYACSHKDTLIYKDERWNNNIIIGYDQYLVEDETIEINYDIWFGPNCTKFKPFIEDTGPEKYTNI